MRSRIVGFTRLTLAAFCLLLLAGAPNGYSAPYKTPESDVDPEIFRVDEKEFLGVKLKSGAGFIDQEGKSFSFTDLGEKPFILVLAYYTCDGSCSIFNAELADALEKVNQLSRVKAGEDFSIVTLSFDKNDTPASARRFISEFELPDSLKSAWKVGVFADKEMIEPFTKSLGYKFFWSPADKMFMHPSAYYFISPEKRVIRILHDPAEEPKDMELAILDTKFSRMKPAEIVSIAVSLCYSYNYKEGKYGLNYPLFIALGSLFTGIGAFAFAARKAKNSKQNKIQ